MSPGSVPVVTLEADGENPLLRRHPWVRSGAVARVEGEPRAGETVEVRGDDGSFLARGAYSPDSRIRVRVWTFREDVAVGPRLFRSRLERAVRDRESLRRAPGAGGYRLVNAESDGLPGLVVDRYEDVTVCQFLAPGADRWKGEIVDALQELLPARTVCERSDGDVRLEEGLPRVAGVLVGPEPPELVEIREGECRFLVDVRRGPETGFYLDQRENRSLVTRHAGKAEVLDVFACTGAFSTAALRAGARRVVQVESSSDALEIARRHRELNELPEGSATAIRGDAFEVLRDLREEGEEFDVAVVDPPPFADSRDQGEAAARSLKEVNLQAFRLLRPGGLLFTFSRSGPVTAERFRKIVADAALDAGREARIVGRMEQAPDHPVALGFPEGRHLKGLVCRVG